MKAELKERIERALANGKNFVGSIEEAKRLIAEANEPMVIQFRSRCVALDDKAEIDALSNSIQEREIFILYDEADMLQTKAQRIKSNAAVHQNGAL